MTIYLIAQLFRPHEGSYSIVFDRLASHAHAQGHRVVLICKRLGNEPALETLPYADVIRLKVVNTPVFGGIVSALSFALKTRAYFRSHQVLPGDIIVSNAESCLGILDKRYVLRSADQPPSVFLRRMSGAAKLSLLSRMARALHLALLWPMEWATFRRAGGIMFSSLHNRRLFDREYGCASTPFFLPRSGVDCASLRQGRRLPCAGRFLLFVSLNNERARKGVADLERALPSIFDDYPDVRLLHVGLPLRWHLPARHQRRIISVGKVPWVRMRDYYKTATCLVSCSVSEGFPNTILEAMAAGLPVVTSDIIGIKEYLGDGKEGRIYARGDSRALSAALRDVLDHPGKAAGMSQAASRRVAVLDYPLFCPRLLRFCAAHGRN